MTSRTLNETPSPVARPWGPTAGIFFANGATFGIWATQIPLVRERLGLDTAVLGILLLVLGAGAVSAMAASGWLIRRFGSAALTRLSAAIFIATLPLAAIVPNLAVAVPVMFVFGAAGGSMDVAMNAHAAEVERRVGRVYMSSFHGMWSVGGLVGAGLGSLMLGVFAGPVQALVAAVLAAGIVAVSQHGLLARVPPPEGHAAGSLRPDALALAIGTMAALCFAAEGSVLDWSSLFLRAELGAPAERAGFGYAAFSAAMAAGRFVGDALRSRFGAAAIIRAGAALAVLGLLIGPATGSDAGAIAGFALAGLGLSNVVPVLISAAGAGPRGDVAIATVTTLGYGGLLAAPPLLGFLAQATSLSTMFLAVAGMSAAVFLGAGIARTRRPA
ncbi:MAG TPA: MFS transporter [Microvirga sp.]|jgi:predicted MFS family arabinose efflux permease|nr:MFS transporter [Microvirga sp.]